jgi:HEAT repeat protein
MAPTLLRLAGLGLVAPLFVAGAAVFGQETRPAANGREAELIGVLKSSAPLKQKADACRELSLIGTKESVGPLAAMLSDEKVAHLARYALEPIPDPAVDVALRDALGKLKGRPLVGVIGSIGVRRDSKAIGSLSGLLKDKDADVARAAARVLGSIGNPDAVKVLMSEWEDAAIENRAGIHPAIAEGLFRCAETLTARDRRGEAIAIYQMVSGSKMPQPIRDAAARKARFLSQEAGPTL